MASKIIFHIDDDEDDQEIFLTAVSKIDEDIVVQSSCTGPEALQLLLTGKVRPDFIFLDFNMPMMNGLEFLAEMNKQNLATDIPVIILSTSSHEPTIKLALQAGAAAFISKPADLYELADRLTEVLGK